MIIFSSFPFHLQYAFQSQAIAHGLDPKSTILELSPREGEFTLREEDILATIEKEGDSIALVLFSGIQYYTGQWFPMENITKKAKDKVIFFLSCIRNPGLSCPISSSLNHKIKIFFFSQSTLFILFRYADSSFSVLLGDLYLRDVSVVGI